MGERLRSRHRLKSVPVDRHYTAVRLRLWLRIKHKTRLRSGGATTSRLYGHFKLVALPRLGRRPWVAGVEVLSESRFEKSDKSRSMMGMLTTDPAYH